MSRVANNPVVLPDKVKANIDLQTIVVDGPKGRLDFIFDKQVSINQADGQLTFSALNSDSSARALAGTTRAIVGNMVKGVEIGFEKKLKLVGVGYRAQVQGKALNLTLGYSHPIEYVIPEGITVETPSPTEVIIKGIDKQVVGQAAANIRRYRSPEPYKGKGVRYEDEQITLKEAKKK